MRRTLSRPPAAPATIPPSSEPGQIGPRLPETGFLRQKQVLAFVPISKSTLWRRVQQRDFPAPVKLSAHVTAWRVEDVRRWIREQGQPGASVN